jgi:Spy/CpxP family protein refolding chaperone
MRSVLRTAPGRTHAGALLLVLAAAAAAAGLPGTAGAQPMGGHHGAHHGAADGTHRADGMRGAPGAMGMPGGMLPGMGAMGNPRMAERMLESIGATAEQKAQIEQIMGAARADMKAQREAGATLRDQARTLMTQPTVDARAAETLRQQFMAQHDQASKRMLQAMLDVSRVLTVEQRRALAERAAARTQAPRRG